MSSVNLLRLKKSDSFLFNLDIGNISTTDLFSRLTCRHLDDYRYCGEESIVSLVRPKRKDFKAVMREPSYTNFKVPFQMVCQERYSRQMKVYEQQFCSEINKIIDNQSSAREATYFVRVVSYTTLWPPYHNESELIHTSRKFFKLTPKEQARFDYIMTHDFSYI